MPPQVLYRSQLKSLKLLHRGKVRDLYQIDDERLLIVTCDRLSAFDVVLPDPIPGKGQVLTRLSNFWFRRMGHLIANHLLDVPLASVLPDPEERDQVETRAVVVKRLRPLPVEAIVRGYLIGSGWKDYQRTGMVCGIQLPPGLRMAERLPRPIYTPSTKAELGTHDQNIDYQRTEELLGPDIAARVRDVSLRIYAEAAAYAETRGIIIADTKFEFGLDGTGELYLIDELLTPDSSRFWPADAYRVGVSPPSFDKQFVRDYLESIGWDKRPPAPHLPPDIIARTAEKYREAARRLMGETD
ncbi:MAG TPA: phosphoribosylaminoimidazolesuccinocarboxamide synthase [Methylothermaceae bacterium]|nr:phosphoribosylaminoimidazolesuccinocarboxamide synthase [Methylothermaceae bacterium]